jgi:hypothetical protein
MAMAYTNMFTARQTPMVENKNSSATDIGLFVG